MLFEEIYHSEHGWEFLHSECRSAREISIDSPTAVTLSLAVGTGRRQTENRAQGWARPRTGQGFFCSQIYASPMCLGMEHQNVNDINPPGTNLLNTYVSFRVSGCFRYEEHRAAIWSSVQVTSSPERISCSVPVRARGCLGFGEFGANMQNIWKSGIRPFLLGTPIFLGFFSICSGIFSHFFPTAFAFAFCFCFCFCPLLLLLLLHLLLLLLFASAFAFAFPSTFAFCCCFCFCFLLLLLLLLLLLPFAVAFCFLLLLLHLLLHLLLRLHLPFASASAFAFCFSN